MPLFIKSSTNGMNERNENHSTFCLFCLLIYIFFRYSSVLIINLCVWDNPLDVYKFIKIQITEAVLFLFVLCCVVVPLPSFYPYSISWMVNVTMWCDIKLELFFMLVWLKWIEKRKTHYKKTSQTLLKRVNFSNFVFFSSRTMNLCFTNYNHSLL